MRTIPSNYNPSKINTQWKPNRFEYIYTFSNEVNSGIVAVSL